MISPAFFQINTKVDLAIGRINAASVAIGLFNEIFAGFYHYFIGGISICKETDWRQIECCKDHNFFFLQISHLFLHFLNLIGGEDGTKEKIGVRSLEFTAND